MMSQRHKQIGEKVRKEMMKKRIKDKMAKAMMGRKPSGAGKHDGH